MEGLPGKSKALLLGSAMFAGLHFSIISFPYLFCVGVVLALVRAAEAAGGCDLLVHSAGAPARTGSDFPSVCR